jgi:hypothetical protein
MGKSAEAAEFQREHDALVSHVTAPQKEKRKAVTRKGLKKPRAKNKS